MMATVTSGAGRPAEANRSVASVPSARRWSAGAMVEIIIGASVCPNSWPSTGPIRVMASSSRAGDIGAAPYHRHCSEDRSAPARSGLVEQHVDDGRRQEGVGDPVPLDQRQELRQVGRRHDHDLPAQGQDREAQDPGRVGERGQREVHRAPGERVAHQHDGRHRLEVAPGQQHALGAAGGPAGARDHGDVVGRARPARARPAARRSSRRRPAPRAGARPGRPACGASAGPGRSPRPAARTRPGRSGRRSRTGRAARGSPRPGCAG